MKNSLPAFVCLGIWIAILGVHRISAAQTNSVPDLVATNDLAAIAGTTASETNAPLPRDEYKLRDDQLMKIAASGGSNALDLVVEGAWGLVRDDPDRPNGYQDLMMAIESYEWRGMPAKSRTMAEELLDSSAPDKYKRWIKGFLNRLDSRGRPVALQFTAVDGSEVDVAKMKGKVVLVEFWSTTCAPCVKELPRVKAAYDKWHGEGLEVIGVSCDTDRDRLNKFLKEKDLVWPQYFDGKQQEDNRLAVQFGVDGIPHMFLVDRKGLLRFDNVRASDTYHAKDDTVSFEDKVARLLAETPD